MNSRNKMNTTKTTKTEIECEYGSLRQRKMNDVLGELFYIEEKVKAIRKQVLKDLKALNEPMDKGYINEKIISIQDATANLLKYVAVSD
jgi:hypothetical protein